MGSCVSIDSSHGSGSTTSSASTYAGHHERPASHLGSIRARPHTGSRSSHTPSVSSSYGSIPSSGYASRHSGSNVSHRVGSNASRYAASNALYRLGSNASYPSLGRSSGLANSSRSFALASSNYSSALAGYHRRPSPLNARSGYTSAPPLESGAVIFPRRGDQPRDLLWKMRKEHDMVETTTAKTTKRYDANGHCTEQVFERSTRVEKRR